MRMMLAVSLGVLIAIAGGCAFAACLAAGRAKEAVIVAAISLLGWLYVIDEVRS